MSALDGFFDFLDNHGNTLAGAAGIYGAIDSANDISRLGSASQEYLTGLGSEMVDNTKFQGYGVTSGLGSSTVGQDGSINLGLGFDQNNWGSGQNNLNAGFNYMNQGAGLDSGQSVTDWNNVASNFMGQGSQVNPNYGAFGSAAQEAMSASLADPSQRQGEIFNQLMAIQNPELNRQQAAQMAQEHAMGRGGIAGSQYGGTSGDAAMAMARAQAGNQAAVNAIQQADAERKMFGDMASQYGQLGNQNYGLMADRENAFNQMAGTFGQLGNQADKIANDRTGMLGQIGYQMGQLGLDQSRLAALPMEMQMKLMDLGRVNAEMAQSGQLTGQDYYAQLALGGANNNINANKVAADMKADLYTAVLNNLGGASTKNGSISGIGGMLSDGWEAIKGIFD